jgi:dihydrofolate reductase
MTRLLRYQVAMSLDGFIASADGGYDWIVADPSIDFGALYREFDTAVMGRKTYEVARGQGGDGTMPGLDVVVFSGSLPAEERKGLRITADDPADVVRDLKARNGRDIWLYGGGELFRALLDAGLVDAVEVAVMPVVLGSGVPLLPGGSMERLALAHQQVLSASGIVMLSYSVPGGAGTAPPFRYVRERVGPE